LDPREIGNEMNSHNYDYHYLDGNAAAGELSNIFTMDVTAAMGQCAHCGATKHFAEAHLYMQGPGIVARCCVCQHVLLRLVNARERVFLDLRGMRCLILDTSRHLESDSSDFQKEATVTPQASPPKGIATNPPHGT